MSSSESAGDSLNLASNEILGIIIAIVAGGTGLTILVLVATMICRRYGYQHKRRSEVLMRDNFVRNSTRASQRSQRISKIVADASERPDTTNTFNINNQPLPNQQKKSPFPPPPDNGFLESHDQDPSSHGPEEIELGVKMDAADDGGVYRQFPRADLLLLERIGEGEYGPIYRGEAYGLSSSNQSTPVTVKMLTPIDTDENRAMFNGDIEMLTCISHPNVVSLLAMCTEDSPECILLDGGLPGDVLTFIRDKKLEISTQVPSREETINLLKLADEITMGMTYLTSERFVHKDLSLRNCIIGNDGVVKVAHFGLGPVMYPEAYYRVHDIDLPIRWMSPEAITTTNFTSASDVWAFGVAMWEIFSYGDLPFGDKSNEEVISLVVREFGKLKRPTRCSEEVFQIAQSCWAVEVNVRPSFAFLHDQIFRLAENSGVMGGARQHPGTSSSSIAETNFH